MNTPTVLVVKERESAYLILCASRTNANAVLPILHTLPPNRNDYTRISQGGVAKELCFRSRETEYGSLEALDVHDQYERRHRTDQWRGSTQRQWM